jgi:hypothetical protein
MSARDRALKPMSTMPAATPCSRRSKAPRSTPRWRGSGSEAESSAKEAETMGILIAASCAGSARSLLTAATASAAARSRPEARVRVISGGNGSAGAASTAAGFEGSGSAAAVELTGATADSAGVGARWRDGSAGSNTRRGCGPLIASWGSLCAGSRSLASAAANTSAMLGEGGSDDRGIRSTGRTPTRASGRSSSSGLTFDVPSPSSVGSRRPAGVGMGTAAEAGGAVTTAAAERGGNAGSASAKAAKTASVSSSSSDGAFTSFGALDAVARAEEDGGPAEAAPGATGGTARGSVSSWKLNQPGSAVGGSEAASSDVLCGEAAGLV